MSACPTRLRRRLRWYRNQVVKMALNSSISHTAHAAGQQPVSRSSIPSTAAQTAPTRTRAQRKGYSARLRAPG